MKKIIFCLIVILNSFSFCAAASSTKENTPVALFILSSHYLGYWAREVIDSHVILEKSGIQVTIATPDGKVGLPNGMMYLNAEQLKNYRTLVNKLNAPKALNDLNMDDFDAVFFPGGLGAMYDMHDNPIIQKTVIDAHNSNKLIAAISHGVAALADVEIQNGNQLTRDKLVTSVSNTEENDWTKERIPFLLEDKFRQSGAIFSSKPRWQSWVIQDGLLLTGQNANSIEKLSNELATHLNQ